MRLKNNDKRVLEIEGLCKYIQWNLDRITEETINDNILDCCGEIEVQLIYIRDALHAKGDESWLDRKEQKKKVGWGDLNRIVPYKEAEEIFDNLRYAGGLLQDDVNCYLSYD